MPIQGTAIAIWHEPDLVNYLPHGCAASTQRPLPRRPVPLPRRATRRFTPKLGKRYPRGFYPEAPTPLYVSRGVGTTLFPSRLLCPPEVSILTLVPAE